jgi:glutamate N-acetyltransferase/amino-acid N-acetyltransferase
MAKSPFAPKKPPSMPGVDGVLLAAAQAGIRYKKRSDVMLALLAPGTKVGGVLTRSRCPSAAVEWCRELLSAGEARALVVNSGNANAFTGEAGRAAVRKVAEDAAAAAGCLPGEVFIASTGVIGEKLDASKISDRLDELTAQAQRKGWVEAAEAIMTTDTFPKLAARTAKIGGVEVRINGFAKGAGMIAPDMATMLAFIFTDAPIAAPVLSALAAAATETSFNAITIDGDTSTSDTLLLFATGAAAAHGCPSIASIDDPAIEAFRAALEDLALDLAHQIVKDAEGVTKFVSITVEGAEDDRAARRIGFSIANSPLVKTAIAGADPNWGRIVMAVGKSGEAAERDALQIWFGDTRVAAQGAVDPDYREAKGRAHMKKNEIDIRVDVGVGAGRSTVWTCDLTKDYIAINADYRS